MNSSLSSSKQLVRTVSKEEKYKNSLIRSVANRKQKLLIISAKVEMLTIDLDIIKREYDVRIGKLYAKDDQLDFEIIRYNRITSLLDQGLSYDEAVATVNKSYEEEANIFTMRFEEIAQEEQEVAKRKEVEEEQEQDIKTLWKKLLFQLHPDLVSNPEEKKRREQIMQKINIAYAQNNYEALESLEQQHYTEDETNSTVESLTKSLVNLENRIIALQEKYKQLRTSEWYMWKKKSEKAKKKNLDLFKELEENLLESIARKIKIVHTFREAFDKKGYY